MAPRKRTTRQRKNDPKSAKLEAFLQDFDSEVETRVIRMKEKLNQLLKDVDNSYNMALIKIPKALRQMPWLELCKCEKPKSPVVSDMKREEDAAIVDSIMAEDHAELLKSVKKMSKRNGRTKSSSDEENIPSTTRKGRTTRKPPSTSKRAKAMSVCKENTSIRRSNRKPLVTPARNMLNSSLMMGATPLITPRFDPRLPKTPAVRLPRHNERVYSFSANGSPIAAEKGDVIINVPSDNGESIRLLASQMDSVDLSQLDETALKNIRMLKNHLASLLEISE